MKLAPESQPIETAPKDGTRVLVWGYLLDVYGNDRAPEWMSGFCLDGDWYIFDDSVNEYWLTIRGVTHWQPLPEPPTAKQ